MVIIAKMADWASSGGRDWRYDIQMIKAAGYGFAVENAI